MAIGYLPIDRNEENCARIKRKEFGRILCELAARCQGEISGVLNFRCGIVVWGSATATRLTDGPRRRPVGGCASAFARTRRAQSPDGPRACRGLLPPARIDAAPGAGAKQMGSNRSTASLRL